MYNYNLKNMKQVLLYCGSFFMRKKLERRYTPNSYCLQMSKDNPNEPHRLRYYDSDGDMCLDIDFNDHHNNKKHPFNHDGAHKHYYSYINNNDGTKTLMDHSDGMDLTDEEYKYYVLEYEKLNPTII